MGCFWGAERKFWLADGVYTTAVGYSGGYTPNPSYEEVCSGRTGHAEAVLVVFDTAKTSYDKLLAIFWEGHDPTQGMRQGNDAGTQYRSAIYTTGGAQQALAERSRAEYQRALDAAGHGKITTEIKPAGPFYYAEGYHQQYLQRNPNGYCGLGGTGVSCPVGLTSAELSKRGRRLPESRPGSAADGQSWPRSVSTRRGPSRGSGIGDARAHGELQACSISIPSRRGSRRGAVPHRFA